MPSPALVEMFAYAGFHWVYIDCEHGPMGWETIENMIRAAEVAGISTQVRPPSGRPEDILHALDAGAEGIVVPHIESVEEAEAVVRACKFYPLGERGMGGVRWSKYNAYGDLEERVKEANEQTLVVVMVESVKGARNAEEIASVEGVDMIRIGPNDLAQSMGLPGQSGHPDVQAMMDRVIASVSGVGKAVATGCTSIESAKRWIERGVLCTNLGLRDLVVHGGRAFIKGVGVE